MSQKLSCEDLVEKFTNAGKTDVIFDFDGTICTLELDWTDWHRHVGDMFKFYDSDFELHLNGSCVHNLQNKYFRKYGRGLRNEVSEFSAEYEEKYSSGCAVIGTVVDLINNLKDINLYVWSSNSRNTVKKYLKKLGVLDRFRIIVSRDEVMFLKPDVEGFRFIAKKNYDSDKYAFVGNSSADEGAAKNLGIDYVDVSELR